MRIQASLIAMAISLAACGPAKPLRDKAFFAANAPERAQTLAGCRNNPARDSSDPDCTSAIQAEAEAEHLRVFHSIPTRTDGASNASHL